MAEWHRLEGGDRPAGGNRRGERPGMTWALRSLCWPSRRAHLLTTGQGPMVVLPDGSRAPSGDGSAGVSCPAGIYQQTPTAACASDAAAPITGGLGGLRPPTSCTGYIPAHCLPLLSGPIKGVECHWVWRYTLIVSVWQIEIWKGTRS